MSPTVALYFLVIIVGNHRFELISKPGLSLEQCYAAGEDWVASGQGHKYECRHINLTGEHSSPQPGAQSHEHSEK